MGQFPCAALYVTTPNEGLLIKDVYIIGWCIIGSICIFSVGNIRYIDALFFAAGASTQSGLNTFVISFTF